MPEPENDALSNLFKLSDADYIKAKTSKVNAPNITQQGANAEDNIDFSNSASDFGQSQYDRTTPIDQLFNSNYDYLRGERQSNWSKAANGLAGMVGKTITTAAEGIVNPFYGSIAALTHTKDGKWDPSMNSYYNNDFTKQLDKLNEVVDKNAPFYADREESTDTGLAKLWHANTIFRDIMGGAGTSIGAALTGVAWSKGLSLVGKALGAAGTAEEAAAIVENVTQQGITEGLKDVANASTKKLIKDGARQGTIALTSATGEAGAEARETEKNIRYKLTHDMFGNEKQMTEGELAYVDMMAKHAGDMAFGMNLPVIMADNWLTFGKVMFGNKTNDFAKIANKTTVFDEATQAYKAVEKGKYANLGYRAGKIGTPMLSEGNQEMLQFAIGKTAEDYYINKYYNPNAADFADSFSKGMAEAYTTQEGWHSGIIGALSAGITSPGIVLATQGKKAFKDEFITNPEDKITSDAVESLNKYKAEDLRKKFVDNYIRQANLTENKDEALEANDDFNYHNANDDMLFSYAYNRLQNGKLDETKQELNNFKDLTVEELKTVYGIDINVENKANIEAITGKGAVQKYVQDRLDKLAKVEETYNQITKLFPNAHPEVKELLMYSAQGLENTKQRKTEVAAKITKILQENSEAFTSIGFAEALLNKDSKDHNMLMYSAMDPKSFAKAYNNLDVAGKKLFKKQITEADDISPVHQTEILKALEDVEKLKSREVDFTLTYNALKDPKNAAIFLNASENLWGKFADIASKKEVQDIEDESTPASNEEIIQYLGDKIINRKAGEQFTIEEQQYYENNKSAIEAYVASKAKPVENTPETNNLASKINIANSKEDLDIIWDEYFDETNGEELGNLMNERMKTIDEQNSHLEAVDTVDKAVDNLNKQDHVVEINNFKTSLESIKGLSNYETFSDELKNRLDSTLSKINNLLVATDDNYDVVNDTSNDTTTVVTQNNDIQTNTSLGLQNSIINFKSFSSKVYNAVMMKLFESHYVANKGFQFIKNNEGEAIRTSTLTSMVVNDPSIVKTGDLISFELITLPENQEQDNLANINTSKKIISDDKSGDYTNEDKEFGKYYNETIGIRHKESNELIGFVAIPHAISVSEIDDEKSILAKQSARKALIEQRKKIVDLLDENKIVETKIFEKGRGKLLLKSNKDGVPIMSTIISRDQDLIDGRDIFVIDKGYDENGNIEGFVIPNSDNFNKTKDKVKINEINNNLIGRTFSDKNGNNKGRVFKVVKNANGSWSLIPVYSTNIGITKAQSLVNKLKKFITPVEDGYTVDLKAVYKELGKDIYITNTDKRGSLKIDKFTINGRPWGALLNNKSFEEHLIDHISKSKNNITTQLLNIDNTIKNILETNAYQEDGQYFVQPYIEFEGLQESKIEDKVIEEIQLINPITIEDKLDLNDDVSSIGNIIDDKVFSRTKGLTPLDRDKISTYLRNKLPGLTLADEKTVNDTKPFVKDAVGMFYKSTIYLFNGASNFTAYHEAFHGVFRNMLSVEERTNILSEAKKQFTAPTEEQLNDLSNTLTSETKAKLSKDKLNTVLEQLYYEEQLADAFAEYTDNLDSKSLLGKIKDFFNRIFKVFNLFKRYNEDQITTLFENINTGTFRETSKQSLYNRSINSELLTPAYKKPNNVPLSEFLDRSKSIEDIFYYRFNQQLELGIALDKIRVGDIFAQIKQEYKTKAIEFNKNKDVYRSAVSANVYNNWSNYLDQVIKNLEKRKIKIKVSTAESLDKEGIPDTTNDVVDLDIEEVETGINKSYGQEMTAISGIRSAGDKLKLFLSALPIIENNKVKKDSYGFEQFYDYEKVYYQLEKALLGKQSYEEQYDEVEYLASYKSEMQSVKEALDRLKGEEGELIKKQFRTNFFKQQLKFKLVLFEKDRKSGKYTYKLVDSNRTDIKRSIQDEWENNLIDPSRTKENLVKSSNSEYIIDSKKIKILQQEFNKSNFSKDYLFNTLYRLGIEFRKEDFDKIYKTDNKSIINNINSYLNFLEAKSLDVLNGQESKTTYKKGREALEWFINQQTIFNENLFTESFNNVENSVVYSIQNNSFSSRLLNKLTQGNTDNFIKNLKRDPIYKYLSVLENPYVTKTLQSYAIDGLKDGVGENEGKKYRSIHPNDYTAMAMAAYINSSGNQSLQGISTAIYTPIVPSEKTQAFLNQGPKYSGFIISNDRLIETEDTQRFNKIFWLEADRIKQAIKDKELYESETQLIKDNKLKVRTFNPNPNYHGKNFNGNAYNFNILNYSKALSKDGELYSKIFSEFSGSNLSAQEFFGTSGKYKSEITNEVLTVLNNKYKEQLDSLIASGIIKQSTEGVLSSKVIDLADFDTTISETDKLKNLVAGFSLNTSLFNIEYSLLMNGDPAYYKNSSDWGKRFYQSQAATSSYDSTDFKDGKIQIMAFNDIEQPASKESYDDIISLTKDLSDADITKSILDNDYNKEDSINVADAQFYVSPLLYEKLERSQGKITKEKTKALEIANGSTQGINSKDYHQQIGIMKTFTFGVEWNDKLTRYEPKQIKCAVLPLTESLVADNPLLKKALDKMLSNPDGPQAMALKSTFKALQPSYQNIDNIDSFDMNKVVDLEVENMGLQVDNPNHGLDSENSSTRQLKMLFYGMLDNDTIYGGKKGLDIKNELQQLESKNNLEALNNLVALFANKDERLLKMIGEAITKRNATSIIEKVFDIDTLTGDFRFPLDTLPTRQTIELLSSIFTNNIVLQEFKGGAMVQATSLGFQFKSQFKTLEEQQELVEDTKELKDLQTSLKWIRKENDTTIDYIEVALPYYYSDFLDNNGQFKKDIPEELLRIIGYRIPTEGAHSMLPLKVVKFLPKEYGNVILLPYEITKQMGADFDFDKIYFLSRDYYNKGQELKPYKYDISDTGLDTRYEQYINSVLNTNKEALQAKKEARADAKELNKISKEAGEEVYKYTFQDDINLLVEEGYIVSKEEFAAKPIEDQLTKEARNNRILDLYTSVLRDVNTLNSLIAPSGPGSISDVYDQVAQYKESEVGDYFSFVGQLKIKKLFDDIIGLKGQSALKVTGHAFVSLGNLEAVNNPFKYKQGDKVSAITNLSKIKSNVGGKIVEELSSMMAAILDAVKTPTMLPYLNISSKTINVWSTIVRFGMGTKVASEFTSQEAIGLVSEKLMDNDKQIKDDSQFNNKVVEETFNIYKDKFLNLYNNFDVETISQQFFGKIIDSQKELTTKLNENIVDLDQLSRFAGKSEQVVKDLIKKDTSLTRENKIKELMSFYLTQMQTLKSFENLEDLSKRLQQVDSIFGLNKQVGPTFETVNGKQEVVNEVYNYEYNEEDGMGVFNGIQDLLNEPIINSYININKNFMSLLNQKFGFANDYYNNIKNIIGSGLNVKNDRGLLGIKPEDRDKINSFIFSYLDAYSTMEKEYSQSPEQSGFTDKEFIDEITKLKSEKFDENYQWKIFGNRKMKPETKAAISNSTLIQHLKTRFIKNSDIKTISLKGNRLELAQKEKIIDDFNKFYKNEATKPMVEALVKHSFKYSGFYTGLNSYHNLIDPSILQDMGFITNRGIIKEIINSDTYNPIKNSTFTSRMIDQLIRNNPKMTKTFDLNEDKGSKLFTESIVNGQKVFVINDKSRHSRASELFKVSKDGEVNALSYIRIYLSDEATGFKGSKLFKLIELENGNKGYVEVSKLGVPKNLVEVNPYFDLEKSVYQPNNYVKFTKSNDELTSEEEQQSVEGENNIDTPVKTTEQLLDEELDNSYNKQKQIPERTDKPDPKEYTNYSGAAKGGDTVWEQIGKEFGIGKQVNYTPNDLSKLTPEQDSEVENAYQKVVRQLGRRPLEKGSYSGGLVRRDYLQAKAADAVFAISSFEGGNYKQTKVKGGTAYAVQSALNLGKTVYLFDQEINKWFMMDLNISAKPIELESVPRLTKKYAGIGTREINENGIKAIREVYEKTFNDTPEQNLPNNIKPC